MKQNRAGLKMILMTAIITSSAFIRADTTHQIITDSSFLTNLGTITGNGNTVYVAIRNQFLIKKELKILSLNKGNENSTKYSLKGDTLTVIPHYTGKLKLEAESNFGPITFEFYARTLPPPSFKITDNPRPREGAVIIDSVLSYQRLTFFDDQLSDEEQMNCKVTGFRAMIGGHTYHVNSDRFPSELLKAIKSSADNDFLVVDNIGILYPLAKKAVTGKMTIKFVLKH